MKNIFFAFKNIVYNVNNLCVKFVIKVAHLMLQTLELQ